MWLFPNTYPQVLLPLATGGVKVAVTMDTVCLILSNATRSRDFDAVVYVAVLKRLRL